MKILYVTKESPLLPAGGIGTYIGYAASAQRQIGNEVYLLTWSTKPVRKNALVAEPFKRENVKIVEFQDGQVWKKHPSVPLNHGISVELSETIDRCVKEWGIDVVEATDYLYPALHYFQKSRARGRKEVLCVTYNHGFIQDVHEAARHRVGDWDTVDLVGERQQCRVSDVVIAPSQATARRLAEYGINHNVEVVREPYAFEACKSLVQPNNSLTHLGRVTVAKGIDRLIYLANILNEFFPIEKILMMGSVADTPYKRKNIKEYILSRLHKNLGEYVLFTGPLKRSAAVRMLTAGDIAPSLSLAETFSYTFLETLDRGLLPIAHRDTAIEEFYPDDLKRYLIDFRGGHYASLAKALQENLDNAPEIVARLQEYNKEELDPLHIAESMSRIYEQKLDAKKGVTTHATARVHTAEHVTVLMPVMNPTLEFPEAIDSIATQTAGIPKVLICDDGTPAGKDHLFVYAETRLPSVEILHQPNQGLLGARNSLIAACKTELSVFLDADDILAPQFLENLLHAYNNGVRRPNAILTFRYNFGEANDQVMRHYLGDHVHLTRNDYRMTGLVETAVLREIGFDASHRNGEADDWDFWLKFFAAGYVAEIYPEFLFHYRFQQGSMSWPWSEGQAVGSQVLVRDAAIEIAHRVPQGADMVARALYTLTTAKH